MTVATGDLNDDGQVDIIVGAATGLAHVTVVNGASAPTGGEVGGDATLADFLRVPRDVQRRGGGGVG